MDEIKQDSKKRWYFQTYVLVIAFLCIGPFAMPLAWVNPNYSIKIKIAVSLIILVVSILLGMALSASIESIMNYYGQILNYR